MTRNLTIEELTKVHEIGARAEELCTRAKERGYELVYDFAYGIYRACSTFILKVGDTAIYRRAVLDIFKYNNELEDAFSDIEGIIAKTTKEAEIAKLEKRLAELRAND